jgi:hypothetical protein
VKDKGDDELREIRGQVAQGKYRWNYVDVDMLLHKSGRSRVIFSKTGFRPTLKSLEMKKPRTLLANSNRNSLPSDVTTCLYMTAFPIGC